MKNHKQQGLSLTGFLMVLAVVGFALFIGMKLFPMYQQYWALKKALKSVAADSAVGSDAVSIRKSLDKYFDVGYISDVKSSDIKVERSGEGTMLIADYEVRRPLIYNLDIVGKFKASELKRSGGE